MAHILTPTIRDGAVVSHHMRQPQPTADEQQPAVIAAKIMIPLLPPPILDRAALHVQLTNAQQHAVTLVSAAAGYGKTTLLSEWCRATADRRARTVWITLDRADNEPVRFWLYVLHAVHTLYPGFTSPLQTTLHTTPFAPDTVVTSLCAAFAGMPQPITLVLDNYHVITDPTIHTSLAQVSDYLPRQVHLVIATRADPPLPLARWRAAGTLYELRNPDLRLTTNECSMLLNAIRGCSLEDQHVAALATATGGWVTGVHLLARSLPTETATPVLPAGCFDHCPGQVAAYLADEVWQQQPSSLQRFLLDTSILDQLTGPVCNAVTGRHDSAALLDALQRANMFLAPCDSQHTAYRYHPLFAAFLRDQLQHIPPDAVTALHRRAAQWYEHHGQPADAITHALAGEAPADAVRLIVEHAERWFVDGMVPALLRWIAALPSDVVANARLCLIHVRALMLHGQLDGVAAQLRTVTQHHEIDTVRRSTVTLQRRRTVSRGVWQAQGDLLVLHAFHTLLGGDRAAATTLLTQATRVIEPDDLLPCSLLGALRGTVAWMRGDLDAAQRVLQESHTTHLARHVPDVARLALSHHAHLDMVRGRLQAASTRYRQVLRSVHEQDTASLAAVGMATLGLSRVLYERNDLAGALAYAHQAVDVWQRRDNLTHVVGALAHVARIAQAQGDTQQAQHVLAQAEHIVWQAHVAAPAPLVLATAQAEVWLAQGDAATAATWLEQYLHTAPPYLVSISDAAQLVLARVQLAQGQPDVALAQVHHLRQAAEHAGRHGRVVACFAVEALAWEAQGDRDQALAVLERAIEHASSERYQRSILDAGAAIPALLRHLLPRTTHAAYVRILLGAGAPSEERTKSIHAAQILSAREREVLQLVAAGASNEEIAHTLVITISTVKKHLRQCFHKLNVRSRTQAVAAARALTLL